MTIGLTSACFLSLLLNVYRFKHLDNVSLGIIGDFIVYFNITLTMKDDSGKSVK